MNVKIDMPTSSSPTVLHMSLHYRVLWVIRESGWVVFMVLNNDCTINHIKVLD